MTDTPLLSVRKHDIVTLPQLDNAVYEVQQDALRRGMIPIAGLISRPVDDEHHEILGYGNNRLADGLPGIHGETGAIMNMGRVETGYADLVCTSSLSPCPFCQNTLARQLGIRTIRILDDANYVPNKDDYKKAGITPIISPHQGIMETFGKWVNDKQFAVLWNRDIGNPSGPTATAPSFTDGQLAKFMNRAVRLAMEGQQLGEAPVGAVIVDDLGEVIGSGFAAVTTQNDPSAVAAMSAWRAAGSRDDWGRHTLVLTAGPDYITLGMFSVFKFGQLIIGSDRVYPGQIQEVKGLNKPVRVLGAPHDCDDALNQWLAENTTATARQYFGSGWRA